MLERRRESKALHNKKSKSGPLMDLGAGERLVLYI